MTAAAPQSRSRRALLRGQARAVIPHRPPWALEEVAFTEACSRCGDCLRVCPEAVLRVGDGGFPEIDIGAGECTFCADCVGACTTGALDLERGLRSVWRAEIGSACLGHAGVVCQSCRDACPERALSFPLVAATVGSPGIAVPRLDSGRCTGCAACIAVCPADTITLRPRHEAPV